MKTHAYVLNGIGKPHGQHGFVNVTIDGAKKMLTTQAAKELARDLLSEAEYEDQSMAVLRSGLLHKYN